MALTQRLELRQSQALVMTPQLMQAIKLLQLSNLDLATYVEGELERNPLLERTGDGEEDRRPVSAEAPPPDQASAEWIDDRVAAGPARDDVAVASDDVPAADTDAASSRSNSEPAVGYAEWTNSS